MSEKFFANGAKAMDLSSFSGTAIDTNSGTKSAGTLRVVIATDQPAFTTAVPVSDNSSSLTVDNAGTFAVQVDGAALTALQLIDDIVFTDDAAFTPATSKVAAIGAIFDAVATDSVDEGDIGALRMSGNRNLFVNIRDNAGNERGLNIDASGQLAVTLASGQTLGTVTTVTTVSTVSALGTGTTGPQKAEDVAAAAGDMGIAAYAVRTDTPVSGANVSGTNDYLPLITDSFGKLWVTGSYAEDVAHAAGDALMAAAAVRLDTPVSGANASGSGDYVPLITDSFGKLWVAGTYAEDLAHTAGEPILGMGARRIDTAASSAGTSGDWATVDASAEGAIWATLTPTTTSGLTIFKSIDIDESEEEVKATAGNVYGYYFANTTASARYLKWYNATAANVTVGTTTPVITMYLPPTSAGHVSFPYPITFSTAICVAATTGVADADTGAPGANDCLIMVYYK